MKFATVLTAAGILTEKFQRVSEIPIVLYDGKDRIDPSDTVQYNRSLFAGNNNSFLDFLDFLKELEETSTLPETINIKIDENSVIVFYKTTKTRRFSRKPKSMEPIDFMN